MGLYIYPLEFRAPKDKAPVEGSVSNISTWLIAVLRNEQCFTLDELN